MASNVSTFPTLPKYPVASLPLAAPVPLIKSDTDVVRWHRSRGYQLFGLFLQRLNEAVVGHELHESGPNSLAVDKLIGLLNTVDSWVDEIPPLPTPQRFGNLAFRDWGRRLEEQAPALLTALLPEELEPSVPHLVPYLVTSFGSFGRIDYGSGHELSFALFLHCLCLLHFVEPTEDEERQLVLRVFFRYLRVVWRLQDVYQLEPAGSHGVWGLDDYHFLSYVWGSAQIREDVSLKPTSILYPPLPPTNLYNLSIMRIHALKRGPFHEHSPQLYSIAVGVQGWRKVNSGMLKMYEAEVLAKEGRRPAYPVRGADFVGCSGW
ncbi:hypothetical protein BS47DRAFT_126790 [Hydnum rufescens UP504]|uniref:Serine/threonine-protein phosphatase 2A activator n=1 Tax=Hydnum rufescens UP504 TaxID=1448309 RepID=A0A9P6DSQ7_9AGAM|nr:hypothetical protein BS47DRAFT_126790 [Hydnum rufescens UP504]